jgi:hypothetical protein
MRAPDCRKNSSSHCPSVSALGHTRLALGVVPPGSGWTTSVFHGPVGCDRRFLCVRIDAGERKPSHFFVDRHLHGPAQTARSQHWTLLQGQSFGLRDLDTTGAFWMIPIVVSLPSAPFSFPSQDVHRFRRPRVLHHFSFLAHSACADTLALLTFNFTCAVELPTLPSCACPSLSYPCA